MYPSDYSGSYSDSTLTITQRPTIYVTNTTATITVNTAGMTTTPASYTATYNLAGQSPTTVTSTFQTFTLNNLASGKTYFLTVVPYNASSSPGKGVSTEFSTPANSSFASPQGYSTDPAKGMSAKSFLRLSNSSNDKVTNTIAYRSFPGISLTSPSTIPYGLSGYVAQYYSSYSTKYYSFSTTLYFDSIISKAKQSAGLGFFVSGAGTTGYFVIVDTTETAASQNKKEVRILKVEGGSIKSLKDSQKNTVTSLNGVYGGRSYTVDVKVMVSSSKVIINAYINGFKITATDEFNITEVEGKQVINKILPPTNTVALLSKEGEAIFDYFYANNLTEEEYKKSGFSNNSYKGVYSNDILDIAFGDIVYNESKTEDASSLPDVIDEFGTSVREIKKTKLRFESAPVYPIKFSTGLNSSIKVLGTKVSNFTGESYILNNTSALTPITDGESASYFIYGNTLGNSGSLEYSSDYISDSVNKEPVVFQSTWIQNLSDAESLGKWIKSSLVNKGKVISMSIFGNPLLAVGDIISIKYLYQGLAGTEKFIVTSIRHSFDQGLETSITCRSL